MTSKDIASSSYKFKDMIINKLKENVLFSISIAGILLSLIIVLNFAFDLFSGFGGFSIQMFLVVYALGIYLIPNLFVSFSFLFITPAILFALEGDPYIINPMQVFIEYFLVFYSFILMWFARFINKKIVTKSIIKSNTKRISFEIALIVFFYILCIVIKFLYHSVASYLYWGVPWIGALSYNALGSLANSSITIPFLIISLPSFIYLKNKHYLDNLSKW